MKCSKFSNILANCTMSVCRLVFIEDGLSAEPSPSTDSSVGLATLFTGRPFKVTTPHSDERINN